MSDLDLSRIKAAQHIYDGKLPAEFEVGQKLIAADAKLLWEGFDYDGLKLDLYGICDRDECILEHVTIAHMRIDIWSLLSERTVKYLEDQCVNQAEQAAAREEHDQRWQKQFGTHG
jgi:hypothetical protein